MPCRKIFCHYKIHGKNYTRTFGYFKAATLFVCATGPPCLFLLALSSICQPALNFSYCSLRLRPWWQDCMCIWVPRWTALCWCATAWCAVFLIMAGFLLQENQITFASLLVLLVFSYISVMLLGPTVLLTALCLQYLSSASFLCHWSGSMFDQFPDQFSSMLCFK